MLSPSIVCPNVAALAAPYRTDGRRATSPSERSASSIACVETWSKAPIHTASTANTVVRELYSVATWRYLEKLEQCANTGTCILIESLWRGAYGQGARKSCNRAEHVANDECSHADVGWACAGGQGGQPEQQQAKAPIVQRGQSKLLLRARLQEQAEVLMRHAGWPRRRATACSLQIAAVVLTHSSGACASTSGLSDAECINWPWGLRSGSRSSARVASSGWLQKPCSALLSTSTRAGAGECGPVVGASGRHLRGTSAFPRGGRRPLHDAGAGSTR